MNSLRNQKPATNRDILSQIDVSTRKKAEAHHLGIYQENLSKLAELEPKLAERNAQIEELSGDKKTNAKEILKLQSEARSIQADINKLNGLVRAAERSDMFKKPIYGVRIDESISKEVL